MSGNERHGRARYNAGCRCDQCKCAENEYRKGLRKQKAESVGEFAAPPASGLRLLTGADRDALTSANAPAMPLNTRQMPANSVVAAVSEEIELLGGHKRPALAAAALALAEILDNPKATSTKPAAAAKLSDLLEQLRKGADGKRSKLAAVRSMTSANASAKSATG